MDDSNNFLPQIVQNVRTNDHDNQHEAQNQNHKVKNLICFWMVGLCNGFGWTVMLSATYDILKRLNGVSEKLFTEPIEPDHSRECIQTSPAILLLANTIPALIVKLFMPSIRFHANANIVISGLLAAASFVMVAVAHYEWQAILGIVMMSISAALGDTTLYIYLAKFIDRKNLLLALSSGIGASGVAASISYASLIDVGFTPKITLVLMLVVPLLELVGFLCITETNALDLSITSDSSSTTALIDDSTDGCGTTTDTQPMTFSEKRQYLPKLLKYFTPLLINYICEYLINQMFDLLYVPGIWLSHADQYRWLQVIAQIGSLVGRSSLSYISLDEVWPLNLLMITFTMYFAFEAIFMTVPIIWVVFVFVFLVGFVGGCTILIVFFQLTNETLPHHQVFAVCSVSIGVSVGVITAALLAIPIHDVICKLPAPL